MKSYSNSICAAIVCYNPDIDRLIQCINSVICQVTKVYIIDNNSNNCSIVASLIKDNDKIVFIENTSNVGIATALNQLCKVALDDGFKWVLTLDQDTVCQSGLVASLASVASMDNIGIVCPKVRYEGRANEIIIDDEIVEISACMTSASLTNIMAWKDIGGFRDDYFIDFVDNEFCLRLRLAGYKIVRNNGCYIEHQLGITKTKKICGVFKVQYAEHSPWRFYYMIRNNRSFIKQYKEHLPIIKEYLKLWYILLKGVIFADDKLSTVHYVYYGYMDGRKMSLGPMPETIKI